jgi:glucosamine-phosphate N-acetyltransferase
MPFAQDSDLELLFNPALIPTDVRSALHSDLHVRRSPFSPPVTPWVAFQRAWTRDWHPGVAQIRPLAIDDYNRGHLEVLKVLSKVSDPGLEAYKAHFKAMVAPTPEAQAYYVISIVDKATDRVVATGTIFIEKKFLRGLGSVGHIEDIAVNKDMQGKKLGLRVIQTLTNISEKVGCYKTILNCSDENIRESCGSSAHGWN